MGSDRIDGHLIALKARIATPDGWSVSAHAGVELPENPAAAIEQAELRALARALDLAGNGLTETPGGPPGETEAEPSDAPALEPAPPAPITRSVTSV